MYKTWNNVVDYLVKTNYFITSVEFVLNFIKFEILMDFKFSREKF